jgi:hypothetical protein
VKQVLLKTLERMGHVLVRADAWRELQRQMARAETPALAPVVTQPIKWQIRPSTKRSGYPRCW